MTKPLYRFEAAFDGEPQGCGLFTALYEVGLPEELPRLVEAMFQHLASPNLTEPASFWFTEAGLVEFAEAITYIATVIGPYNWGLVMARTEYGTGAADTLYEDDYQVAIAYECRPDAPEDYRPVEERDILALATEITEREAIST